MSMIPPALVVASTDSLAFTVAFPPALVVMLVISVCKVWPSYFAPVFTTTDCEFVFPDNFKTAPVLTFASMTLALTLKSINEPSLEVNPNFEAFTISFDVIFEPWLAWISLISV
ncbi:hypothetical protein D3C86_1608310 [compost metagenome]